MNDQDCIKNYSRLARMLEEKGLGWVTAQVAEQIKIGKTIQREIETLREGKETLCPMPGEDYPSRLKKGPRATFPVTVEYQPSEQLELLIDAVKQAIVNTADMEHELVNFLKNDEKGPKRIEFYTEDPNIEPKQIDGISLSARQDGVKRLNELLEDLRKEIHK